MLGLNSKSGTREEVVEILLFKDIVQRHDLAYIIVAVYSKNFTMHSRSDDDFSFALCSKCYVLCYGLMKRKHQNFLIGNQMIWLESRIPKKSLFPNES